MYKNKYLFVLFLIPIVLCTAGCTLSDGTPENAGGSSDADTGSVQVETEPPGQHASENTQGDEGDQPGSEAADPGDQDVEQQPSGEEGGVAQKDLPASTVVRESPVDPNKVIFLPGTGGGGGLLACYDLAMSTENLSGVYLEKEKLERNVWGICLFDIPAETVEVTVASAYHTFQEQFTFPIRAGSFSEFGVWVPVSFLFEGPFSIDIVADGESYHLEIELQEAGIDVYGAAGPYVFNGDNNELLAGDGGNFGSYSYPTFRPGDRVPLFGAGFLPNEKVQIGLYNSSPFFMENDRTYHQGAAVLVKSFEVIANQDGAFIAQFDIDDSFGESRYYLLFGDETYSDLNYEDEFYLNKYPRIEVENDRPYWTPCDANYPSGLRVGQVGIVSDEEPTANNVRSTPAIDGEKIGEIQVGETMLLLDGPVCSGGLVWWFVHSIGEQGTIEGWTAEGDQDSYWIVPWNHGE